MKALYPVFDAAASDGARSIVSWPACGWRGMSDESTNDMPAIPAVCTARTYKKMERAGEAFFEVFSAGRYGASTPRFSPSSTLRAASSLL